MTHFDDPRATDQLVAAYAAVLGFVRHRYPGLPDDDHEVVVQEAYVRVLQRLAKGPLEDPVAYLFRVARNTGARLLGRRRRMLELVGDVPTEPDAIDRAIDPSLRPLTPEEQVIARAETALVLRVLATDLTERERRSLVLRRFERRSPKAVAAALGTSERGYRHVIEDAGRHLAAGVERARIREAGTRVAHADGRAAPALTRAWTPNVIPGGGTAPSCSCAAA